MDITSRPPWAPTRPVPALGSQARSVPTVIRAITLAGVLRHPTPADGTLPEPRD